MSDDIKSVEAAVAAAMNNIGYIKMLLGIAVSRFPDGLVIERADYDKLVGRGLVLTAGDKADSFRLVIKPLPGTGLSDTPMASVVGEA